MIAPDAASPQACYPADPQCEDRERCGFRNWIDERLEGQVVRLHRAVTDIECRAAEIGIGPDVVPCLDKLGSAPGCSLAFENEGEHVACDDVDIGTAEIECNPCIQRCAHTAGEDFAAAGGVARDGDPAGDTA